jgi:two-component system phosphate regulon sensor histidine kinase PhoR
MPRLLYRFLILFFAATAICLAAAAAARGLDDLLGSVRAELLCAIGGGLFAAILASATLYQQWLRPMRRVLDRGRQIVQAEWRGQVSATGAHEIRDMADAFNRLTADTYRRLSSLQHQQADLNALVDALPDPILAGDSSGRLILMNAPAAALLGLSAKQAHGQMVVSVVSDEPVVELFEAAAQIDTHPDSLRPTIQKELRLSRGSQKFTYQAVAARTADGGTLVVLRDVSALAQAIQMKTDFVANASHELRTPITAIKIAFETLGEAFLDDPEQAQKCMTVIDGHLRRLEDMLRDLLDLSRVEVPDHDTAVTTVKSADLFNTVRGTLLPMARQKLVELAFDEPQPPAFASDFRLLNLILKNLVENSVKYTPVGGKVTVSLTPTINGPGPAVELKVADTGIGIAPEHIDRVFERFYQVDSARSGSAGRGTGLGLAIVKHAVLALGGTVSLQSQVNVGTTVTCLLPQPPGAEDDTAT